MRDASCVSFLQWALPQMHMRWAGFRKVRGQVCKRIGRRLLELGLADVGAYRDYLSGCPDEWRELEVMCRITISRFYRDRGVFDSLSAKVLPGLATTARLRGDEAVHVWSAGCGAGEELYTVAMVWQASENEHAMPLHLVGTDIDEHQLERARRATYAPGCMKDLPSALRASGFTPDDGKLRVRDELREHVELRLQDVRREMPEGPFHLILCRNLVFTYFDDALQRALAEQLVSRLVGGGVLVLGCHEQLPPGLELDALEPHLPIHRRPTATSDSP